MFLKLFKSYMNILYLKICIGYIKKFHYMCIQDSENSGLFLFNVLSLMEILVPYKAATVLYIFKKFYLYLEDICTSYKFVLDFSWLYRTVQVQITHASTYWPCRCFEISYFPLTFYSSDKHLYFLWSSLKVNRVSIHIFC